MTGRSVAPPGIDLTVPLTAWTHDFWLHGQDNVAEDRTAALEAGAAEPRVATLR
ncbi:MAG: hypothetical protein ACRDNW_15395 [Trebonia sp.]